MALTPEQEKPFNDLKAARAEKTKQRDAQTAAEAAFEQAREAEAKALRQIAKQIGKLKPGEDRHLTTSDGTQWHVEIEDGRLRVEQVKSK